MRPRSFLVSNFGTSASIRSPTSGGARRHLSHFVALTGCRSRADPARDATRTSADAAARLSYLRATPAPPIRYVTFTASRHGRGTCGGPQRCRLRVSDVLIYRNRRLPDCKGKSKGRNLPARGSAPGSFSISLVGQAPPHEGGIRWLRVPRFNVLFCLPARSPAFCWLRRPLRSSRRHLRPRPLQHRLRRGRQAARGSAGLREIRLQQNSPRLLRRRSRPPPTSCRPPSSNCRRDSTSRSMPAAFPIRGRCALATREP